MTTEPVRSLDPMLEVRQQLEATLEMQRKAYFAHPMPTFAERKADLLQLKRFVADNKEAIIEAINADYGNRSRHETLFAEIFTVFDAIKHTLRHLKGWMKPQRRPIDMMTYMGAKNRVVPQPLGVVGVIVPWNFPINLSIMPLVYIFAAGNRAMVKMSENSRHLAALMIEKMPNYFPPEKLSIFDETGTVGIEFSQLPFDHLLFTGSSQTGRKVMAAAAQNLCPVTLELGGKAPAVVCDDYPLRKAAERIMFVKMFNNGQICTNIDYMFLPEGKVDEFVQLAKEIVPQRYPQLSSPDLTSVIDDRAFNRLTEALEEAESRGARIEQLIPGPRSDAAARKLAPHLVIGAPDDTQLMQREIFGPLLPIRTYRSLEEVIEYINSRPRPLALYPFSHDKAKVQLLVDRVMSGGVSVNDALFHVAQHDLPFGGVGDSGMGHYHGREGFETFSKLRPIFYQAPISSAKFLAPPYGKFADKVLDFLTKG
jgi:coniferyl-aldehyde dehydrogenase